MPRSEAGLSRLAAVLGTVHTPSRQYAAFPQLSAAAPDAIKEQPNGRIPGLLGEGGFAQVFLATAEDDETVALKRMTRGAPFGRFLEQAERWAAELLVVCAADHPHVICCYGWGIEQSEEAGGQVFRLRMVLPLMTER